MRTSARNISDQFQTVVTERATTFDIVRFNKNADRRSKPKIYVIDCAIGSSTGCIDTERLPQLLTVHCQKISSGKCHILPAYKSPITRLNIMLGTFDCIDTM